MDALLERSRSLKTGNTRKIWHVYFLYKKKKKKKKKFK